MARREDELGQPQEDVDGPEATESEDDSEGAKGKITIKSKGKSRRKACQKPEGSDQKRQAFSKRKRGLILKSYQLYKLTDARVFVFIVNDKGSSWAYASPGFARTLTNQHLLQMREYAQLTGNQRMSTEIMPHPHMDAEDRRVDDRPNVVRANIGEAAPAPTTGTPSRAAGPAAGCTPVDAAPPVAPTTNGSAAGAGAKANSATGSRRGGGSAPQSAAAAPAAAAAAPLLAPPLPQPQQTLPPEPSGAIRELAGAGSGPAGPRGRTNSRFNYQLQLDNEGGGGRLDDEAAHDAGVGFGGAGLGAFSDSIITPSGRRMAAAVGIALAMDPSLDPSREDERDMLPPGPRSGVSTGGGYGAGGLALERGTAAAAGKPPPAKYPRYHEPLPVETGNDGSGFGVLPAPPQQGRGRRTDPLLPPPPLRRTIGQDPHPTISSGPNEQHTTSNQRLQATAAVFAQQQHMHAIDLVASIAEEELRASQPLPRGGARGGGGLNTALPPEVSLPPPASRPSSHPAMPGLASGYMVPGSFSSGQVVQGSDGQLYRVLRELDDDNMPVDDGPMLEEGAAQVLLAMPQAAQHNIIITNSAVLGGVGVEGRGLYGSGP